MKKRKKCTELWLDKTCEFHNLSNRANKNRLQCFDCVRLDNRDAWKYSLESMHSKFLSTEFVKMLYTMRYVASCHIFPELCCEINTTCQKIVWKIAIIVAKRWQYHNKILQWNYLKKCDREREQTLKAQSAFKFMNFRYGVKVFKVFIMPTHLFCKICRIFSLFAKIISFHLLAPNLSSQYTTLNWLKFKRSVV